MSKTRMSLYYLASYLWVGGIGFLFTPIFSANLLLSNIEYPAVILQAIGMFMIGVGIIVVQIIRFDIAVLFPTTLIVRAFFCACLLLFYFTTQNPLFFVLFAIVVLGLLLTGTSYLSERRRHVAT